MSYRFSPIAVYGAGFKRAPCSVADIAPAFVQYVARQSRNIMRGTQVFARKRFHVKAAVS